MSYLKLCALVLILARNNILWGPALFYGNNFIRWAKNGLKIQCQNLK